MRMVMVMVMVMMGAEKRGPLNFCWVRVRVRDRVRVRVRARVMIRARIRVRVVFFGPPAPPGCPARLQVAAIDWPFPRSSGRLIPRRILIRNATRSVLVVSSYAFRRRSTDLGGSGGFGVGLALTSCVVVVVVVTIAAERCSWCYWGG